MKTLTTIDKVAYLFLIVIYGFGIYFANTDLNYFDEFYTVEDGFIEVASAIFLLSSSLLLLYRFIKLFKHKDLFWKIGILGLSIVFFFGAGEEISWGQRIFNLESSQYFLANSGW